MIRGLISYLDSVKARDPAPRSRWEVLLYPGVWALFWHRFGNWRMSVRPRFLRAPLTLLYRLMFKVCQWVCGVHLPYTVIVGRRVTLEHFGGMVLVADRIGDDVIIRQNTTFGISRLDDLSGRPVICDGVELGAGVVVIGRVRIGEGARVGANAVVIQDVPPGAVVGGVPARELHRDAGTGSDTGTDSSSGPGRKAAG